MAVAISRLNLIKIILIISGALMSQGLYARSESPIWLGSAPKAYAGASILTSQGAEAAFYNPASIYSHKPDELQYDLAIASIKYEFTYPGFASTEISKGTFIPYLGFNKQLDSKSYFSLSILPYPGSAEKTEIKKLPTREAGEIPFLINVTQQGPTLAWQSAFAWARELNKQLIFGTSLLYSRDGVRRTVHDDETGIKALEEDTSNDLFEILLGLNYLSADKKLKLGIMSMVYGQEKSNSKTETFGGFGYVSENSSRKEARPMQFGVASSYSIHPSTLMFEAKHTRWSAVKSDNESTYDYFDTTSYAAGCDFQLNAKKSFGFAVGYYPTHLGDGIMSTRAEDEIESIGFKTGNLDGFNRKVISLNFNTIQPLSSLRYYIQWQSGQRSPYEDARAYGDHSLNVIFLGAGGNWTL